MSSKQFWMSKIASEERSERSITAMSKEEALKEMGKMSLKDLQMLLKFKQNIKRKK